MTALKRFAVRYQYELFALGGTIAVLWQLLLPGYVLTLDMVFGPAHQFVLPSGFLSALPLQVFLYALQFVLPAWMVEKVLLVALCFCLFYFPLRFFSIPGLARAGRYAAAVFFAINPFVYERFLAGQWGVLFGYALLMPFLFALLALLQSPGLRRALAVALTVSLIAVFSLHLFVIATLMGALLVAVECVRLMVTKGVAATIAAATWALVSCAMVMFVSLYWILPALLHPQSSPLSQFNAADYAAFAASSDPTLGTLVNVAALYGFWGESYPLFNGFDMPKAHPAIFYPSLVVLVLLIGFGVRVLLREKRGVLAAVLLVSALAAYIFSVGMATTPLHAINAELFKHVPFWGGFRDSEKWSAWLALVYSVLVGMGASYCLSRIRLLWRMALTLFILFSLVMYTMSMPLGFGRQMYSVWYPESWQQVDAVLAKAPGCRALSLPWHQYYQVAFDHGLIVSNPAPSYFSCDIISSLDSDIGGVAASTGSAQYAALDTAITQDVSGPEMAQILQAQGVSYVIVTDDVATADPYSYRFLADTVHFSAVVHQNVDNEAIVLYKVLK